jgi:hypothetical protein
MAEILVQVPKELGLSEDQIKELQQKFASVLVGSISSRSEGVVEARPKVKVIHEASPVVKMIETSK